MYHNESELKGCKSEICVMLVNSPLQFQKNYVCGDCEFYNRNEKEFSQWRWEQYRLAVFLSRGLDTSSNASTKKNKIFGIVIREVTIHPDNTATSRPIQITCVSILFNEKAVCKATAPFAKQLYKFVIRNSSEMSRFSIRVEAQGGIYSTLPLPLPKYCVCDNKLDIDFSIVDSSGMMHAGTVKCSVMLTAEFREGPKSGEEHLSHLHSTTNDPNDPQNSASALLYKKRDVKKQKGYFLLEDPALRFITNGDTVDNTRSPKESQQLGEEPKLQINSVIEQPMFSWLNFSVKDWLEARTPSSGAFAHKHPGRKETLSITILRGVEVPVREESALVQPLLEIEWADVVQTTSVSNGPAPIWQETVCFEVPRQSGEQFVKLRLYDRHPVWGLQWLGEARIPVENRYGYQELERWISLSPLCSPVLLLGYVQASPGYSCTRIYVLMRMELPGATEAVPNDSVDTLSKAIQRCMAVPYKISGIETIEDAARLTMLLASLPAHYGPLTPRQALSLNKIDHFGRAALLATLLQGFGTETYVVLGTSQMRKWAAFVLTITDNDTYTLWDSENGDHYDHGVNRCPLIKISRIINHQSIWGNLQKTSTPSKMRFNVRTGRDWQLLSSNSILSDNRTPQMLDLKRTPDDQDEERKAETLEQNLREKLAEWRSGIGLTTLFNRHAVSIARRLLSKAENSTIQPEKNELRQLYRAYHTHGFLLNLRQTSIDDLSKQLFSTKVHEVTGPVEFALVCHIQRYVGNIYSTWLAVLVLQGRK
ncbi:coiled-coil and C2 domain-containing protein 2A isoform X2 [Orussus abietinus]|uniref:coiled-coil and C2 domain-containing protein 2A isoform X2 n=1 Tax=Orussus abietinus TaxID=222816 RepID=UPI000C715D24|nr:coiled-coil and C2 domain-containing protein 2A isoform X2 [Orussus abietinus]